MLRRTLLKYSALTAGLAVGLSSSVIAAEPPAPLDKPGDVKIALVRYLSTGDFFQSYLSGVETQAAAIGLDLLNLRYRIVFDIDVKSDNLDSCLDSALCGFFHRLCKSMLNDNSIHAQSDGLINHVGL